jgi:hypothetical protein
MAVRCDAKLGTEALERDGFKLPIACVYEAVRPAALRLCR